jgi:hypothetical protein
MEQGADARYLHSVTANGTNHVDQSPLERQDDQFDARFDWIPSEMDSLFARFLLGNSNQQIPTGLPDFGQYQQYRGRGVL